METVQELGEAEGSAISDAPAPPWGETGDLTHRDFASVSAEIQGKVKSFQVEAGQVSCGLFTMEWPTAVKTRRPS